MASNTSDPEEEVVQAAAECVARPGRRYRAEGDSLWRMLVYHKKFLESITMLSKVLREKKEREHERRMPDLLVEVVEPGDAVQDFPRNGDAVCIHYIAYLQDGYKFDDSRARGQPVFFTLGAGQIIRGLEEVLLKKLFSKGQRAKVTIPHQLAYGERGYPPIIPPYATLIYDMELTSADCKRLFLSYGRSRLKYWTVEFEEVEVSSFPYMDRIECHLSCFTSR